MGDNNSGNNKWNWRRRSKKNTSSGSLTTFEEKTLDLESAVPLKSVPKKLEQVEVEQQQQLESIIIEKPEIPTPVFSNLDEILTSDLDNSDSVITTINTTINILRPYLKEGLPNLHPFLRPSLWSRAICSRTVLDLEGSSLADSFVTWDNSFQMSEIIIATMETVEVGGGGGG